MCRAVPTVRWPAAVDCSQHEGPRAEIRLPKLPTDCSIDQHTSASRSCQLLLMRMPVGLSLRSDGQLLFTAAGMKAHVQARFHYYRTKFPHIKGSGDVHISLRDGDVGVYTRSAQVSYVECQGNRATRCATLVQSGQQHQSTWPTAALSLLDWT